MKSELKSIKSKESSYKSTLTELNATIAAERKQIQQLELTISECKKKSENVVAKDDESECGYKCWMEERDSLLKKIEMQNFEALEFVEKMYNRVFNNKILANHLKKQL